MFICRKGSLRCSRPSMSGRLSRGLQFTSSRRHSARLRARFFPDAASIFPAEHSSHLSFVSHLAGDADAAPKLLAPRSVRAHRIDHALHSFLLLERHQANPSSRFAAALSRSVPVSGRGSITPEVYGVSRVAGAPPFRMRQHRDVVLLIARIPAACPPSEGGKRMDSGYVIGPSRRHRESSEPSRGCRNPPREEP